MITRREAGLNCTIGRGPATSDFAQTVQARTSTIRAFALGNEAPDRVDEGVEPVVVHPMAGAVELHDLGGLEVLQPPVPLGIGSPALLAVDQQGRAGDLRPQAFDCLVA